MQLWKWNQWNGNSFLTCELLPLSHGFFTRQFYPASPNELVGALSDSAEVIRVKQVHSANVMTPTEIELITSKEASTTIENRVAFPLADGVVTQKPQQSVWACSADCTPALICDARTKQAAAVHAGWRGTAKKILPIAIAQMIDQGSRLEDLRVALGPAIDGTVYQVDNSVAYEVGQTVAPDLNQDELIERLLTVKSPPMFSDSESGKVRLDVRRINQMQLKQAGLADEQIEIAPYCTYQNPDLFFSYRRTREKKNQWAGIVSA